MNAKFGDAPHKMTREVGPHSGADAGGRLVAGFDAPRDALAHVYRDAQPAVPGVCFPGDRRARLYGCDRALGDPRYASDFLLYPQSRSDLRGR